MNSPGQATEGSTALGKGAQHFSRPSRSDGFFMDDRLHSELVFHDTQAAHRRGAWRCDPSLLKFPPASYLDHEPWLRPALAKLGPLHGKNVLDFGCGHGMAAVILAQQGADVT